MDSLYFVAMIVGIGWLAVWSALPAGLPFASPFDMLEAPAEAPPALDHAPAPAPAVRPVQGGGWRQRTQPRRSEAAAAVAQQPVPERQPVSSWRLRRDTAPPSRKGR